MHLDLSDEKTAALTQELHDIVESDRYPFSPHIRTLRAILAKLRPEPLREPLPPPAVAERRTELECGTDANLVAHPSHRVGLPNYPAAAIGC
jgi:hypothetical protein